jgi:DNA-binding response OmpR family regulator
MASASTLIVDANPESREGLARILKEAGFPVLTAGSGSEGLAMLSTLRPQVVLLDMSLPGIDAGDLIHQMRLEVTDVVLLALSDYQDTAHVVRTMRAGASDFIVKPATATVLQTAVRTALARSESVAPGELAPPGSSDPERFWPDLDLLFRNSDRMRAVEDIVRRAADTNATILLQGESGTGKEMVAKAIHYISQRREKPFLKVNCASLPGDLLESELFGHEKGAFTGAHRRKPGKFELAHRGTFLLDEIGEMPLGLQAKLLHVLQDGRFFRVGGSEMIETDVRLVAATNRDLSAIMATGHFREDPVLPAERGDDLGAAPARAPRGDSGPRGALPPEILSAVRPRGAAGIARDSAPTSGVWLAGERSGAREHDQAARGPAERDPPPGGDRHAPQPALVRPGDQSRHPFRPLHPLLLPKFRGLQPIGRPASASKRSPSARRWKPRRLCSKRCWIGFVGTEPRRQDY